jgi:hypothetical protein
VTSKFKFTKVYAGYYKANVGADCIGRDAFANVRLADGNWNAEFRYSRDGEIVRFAGIWSTFRDAKDEVVRIAEREFGDFGPGELVGGEG